MKRSVCLILAASSLYGFECGLLVPAPICPNKPCDPWSGQKFTASLLIWQSKEGGLEFASKSFVPEMVTSTVEAYNEKCFVPDFAWRPGVKLEYAYHLPYDGWDLQSRWTYYHGEFTNLKKHFDSVINPEGIGVVPLWVYPFTTFAEGSTPFRFNSGAADWKLSFNSFDLELGRAFLPFPSIPMRLHLGAKGSWIRQHYFVRYTDGTEFTGIASAPPASLFFQQSNRTNFKSHAWGIGPRAGIQSNWQIWRGFSFIGDGAFSILYTPFHLRTTYDQLLHNLTAGGLLDNHLTQKEKIRELVPVAEAKLGFDWSTCFLCRRPLGFGLTVAYEAQFWWAQNHARRNVLYDAPALQWDMRGDLQLHGLTATTRLDF